MAVIGNMSSFDSNKETWSSYVERFELFVECNSITNEKKVKDVIIQGLPLSDKEEKLEYRLFASSSRTEEFNWTSFPTFSLVDTVTQRCNRSGVTLLLVSLSQAALEQVQSNFVPRLCHRQRCNRSQATLFLYAPEIFWSNRTVERKWIRCVLVIALRSALELSMVT
uniref:Uncharacterized protein n=1 Tax=Timema genevievae TaxID=629358 RepID=A0A7R9JRB0_TIMGE|nr:unnamed protein product [Timema genevievae]